LEFILLKTGFVLTGRQAKQLILHGHVLVNNSVVRAYNFKLQVYDLISMKQANFAMCKELLICNLFKTSLFFNFLKKKRISKKISITQFFVYFKFPSFLEVNYKTFTVCLTRKPNLQDFFIPKVISLYDCNQLYFIL
jgi:ribosomal protein S4